MLPETLRTAIPEHGSRRVLQALAAELAGGHRTAAELAERIRRRSWAWVVCPDEVQDATAVAIGGILPRGYDCPDVRCEDHASLDTGLDCQACAYSTPQDATSASEAQGHPHTPADAPQPPSGSPGAVQGPSRPVIPLRPWCGGCDGPELARRFREDDDGRLRRCHCHPGSDGTPQDVAGA